MKFISVYHQFRNVLFLLIRNTNDETFGSRHFETMVFRRNPSLWISKAVSCSNRPKEHLKLPFEVNTSLYLTSEQESIVPATSLQQAIAWINNYCDRQFLHAVVASDYRFLYRGITDTTADMQAPQPSIRNDASDLLMLETYGSVKALEFFQLLEELLCANGSELRPSTGHLATTSFQDAAKWGKYAASIWPLSWSIQEFGPDSARISPMQRNEGSNYAWFRDHGLFYPRSSDFHFSFQKEKTISTRRVLLDSIRRSYILDGQNCDEDDSLADALQYKGCEVLFRARAFLAIPVSFDNVVRHQLKSSFPI
jgi:hypothetical protein